MSDKKGKQPKIVTLMNGVRLRLMPVMTHTLISVMERAGSSANEPKKPTREVDVFGGDTQLVEFSSLDELSGLEDHEKYSEWVEALENYRSAYLEWDGRRQRALGNLAFSRGVMPIDENNEPLSPQHMLDEIAVIMPTDGLEQLPIGELRAVYLNHVAFSTYDEMTHVIQEEWMMLCLPDNEEVEAQYAGFLDNNRRSAGGKLETSEESES